MSKLGEWLGEELERREMKQAALARAIKVTQGTVSRWISGADIKPHHVCKVADGLGLRRDVLLHLAGYDVYDIGEVPAAEGEPSTPAADAERRREAKQRHRWVTVGGHGDSTLWSIKPATRWAERSAGYGVRRRRLPGAGVQP